VAHGVVTASVSGADIGADIRAETAPIGGAFELDAAALLDLDATAAALPEGQSVTSGRTALALLAEQLPGRWLLPAYICETALQPFRRAGIDFDFYSVGDDLRPRLDDLERAVEADEPAAVLVVDYFGFPPEEAERLRALGDASAVVEDCVHGSLLELPGHAAGAIGSIAFTTFRKYLPLPDGGIVVGVDRRDLPPATGPHVRARLLGQLLRGAAVAGDVSYDDAEPIFLELVDAGESALDDVPLSATSEVSARLLGKYDLAEVAERRRANFAALLDAITDSDAVTPIFRDLPPGVSPLLLPVRVSAGARDSLRKTLIARRVYCPVHWNLPADVDESRFPAEHRLSREILGLPIDQRYDATDMERLATAVEAAWEELS
jgi:DegT/DnrJ/EryC1/StrS aminotransferase family